ncbi:MAG: hypothetical protein ACU85E_03005 [Gammaproteobacteria bacterium]
MDKHTADDKGDLWGQLAHLEHQVSVLSSELQSRSETIELLERTLNEKQLHISELEAALKVAQQSMLDLAWDNVQHYLQQMRAGIGHNLADPKWAQLRDLLELIRSFPASIIRFTEVRIIQQGRYFVKVAIDHVAAIRSDSASYYRNTLNVIVAKYRMGLEQIMAFFARFFDEVQNTIDQKILWPIKNVYEDINEALKDAPSEFRLLFRDKVVKPASQTLGMLSVKYSKLQIEVHSLLARLGHSVQPFLNHWYKIVTDKIKSFKDSHGFGASDQGMTGTYA